MHHWICPIRLFRHDSVYYRLQRSCGKVIFSQASVSHSVHGGCGRHHAWADTPLADTPWADLPGQTPHQADTPRQIPPLGRHPQPSACWDTRPPRQPLQRTVRILLECILVLKKKNLECFVAMEIYLKMCKVLMMDRDRRMIFKCLYFLYNIFPQKIVIDQRIMTSKQICVSRDKLNML